MITSRKQHLMFLFFAAVLFLAGCQVPSPAAPPSAPVELPSAFTFPDDIDINLDTIAPETSAALISDVLAQVVPGGEFSDAIVFGFSIGDVSSGVVEQVLNDLNDLDIPLNNSTTTFETATDPASVFGGGDIKIDFADYDFDGDGSDEGCTGCTCPAGCASSCPDVILDGDAIPICYRIWVDLEQDGTFDRLMAGRMDRIAIEDDPATQADEENAGVGEFRQDIPGEIAFSFGTDITIRAGADYNHRDLVNALNLTSEFFISFLVPREEGTDITNTHSKIEQVPAFEGATLEDDVRKTVRASISQTLATDPNETPTVEYTARFRDDANFWSGSFVNTGLTDEGFVPFSSVPTNPDFTAQCAQLSDGTGVGSGSCQDLGIGVTGVPFLDFVDPTDSRVLLPTDFPETPTF